MDAFPWFTTIGDLGSVTALRQRLADGHPGLEAGRLGRMIVVGAAAEGRRLVELCHRQRLEVLAVCDDNPAARNSSVFGHTVTALADLGYFADRSVPVIIASHRPLSAVRRLRAMGFHTIAPFMALQSLAPQRFPPHVFHERLLEDLIDNHDRHGELFQVLADDTSRQHLDAALGYRLTADIDLLEPVIDSNLYHPAGLFTLGDEEIYVDGGAFDGDSIRLFVSRVGGRFARVIAFEPDPVTFQVLRAAFPDPRVTLINAGLHSVRGSLRFNNDGSRASALDEQGGAEVAVISLDEVLAGERVTLIKMNIEGAELEALTGARHTLKHWAPKLAISAYHRPADLWQVAFGIRELNPDYRLYLRQQDAGIVETVAYAVPGCFSGARRHRGNVA